jgi:hypothetical protein
MYADGVVLHELPVMPRRFHAGRGGGRKKRSEALHCSGRALRPTQTPDASVMGGGSQTRCTWAGVHTAHSQHSYIAHHMIMMPDEEYTYSKDLGEPYPFFTISFYLQFTKLWRPNSRFFFFVFFSRFLKWISQNPFTTIRPSPLGHAWVS